MDNKETANKSNLPEKGAEDVNNEIVNKEVNQELVNEIEETPIEEVEKASPVEIKSEDEKSEEVSKDDGEIVNDESKNEKITDEVIEKVEVVEQQEKVEKVEEDSSADTEKEAEPESESSEEVINETDLSTEEDVKKEDKKPVEAEDNSSEKADEEKKEESEKTETIEFVVEDYSILDRPALLTKLNSLINNFEVEVIRSAVEEIKTVFYKKYKAAVSEARKEFVDNGGVVEEFKFADETSEETFKVLYNKFKAKKAILNKKLDKDKAENLRIKYEIIEEIDELINKEESINKTFQEFRSLQQKWRDLGLVPQNSVKKLWESYNHTVEKFYDYIKINKELRDLDLKKNHELKIELCEKAEGLLLESSVTKAFKTLQEYHNQWREIGPVPADQKDDIWDRFKAATTQINKKHQDYFEGLKDQQISNLEQKTALCEKAEELLSVSVEKPREWENKAKEIIEIQKLWRTIGFAPKKDNNKIYQRFKSVCDDFFSRKRDFYKEAKEVQKNNLQLKLDLCVQAEALKDSEEWKKSTEDFIKLQKRWKEIGPVPKKHSETLWKRFRTACDFFFDSKSEFYNTADSRQEDNLKLKLELIEKVKTFEKLDDDKENLKNLMSIQKEWSSVGHVPLSNKDEVQKNFRDAINAQFEVLQIDDNERNKINFKAKVDNWVSTNSRNKIYSERNKFASKIKELENEIALYENNIGFFSASSNAQSLLNDVNKKIEKAKQHMISLKQRLRMLDDAESNM